MLNDSFEFDLNFLDDVKLELDTETKSSSIPKSSSFVSTSTPTTTSNHNNDVNFNNNNITYTNEIINLTKRVENYNKVVLRLRKLKTEKQELEKNLQGLNQSAIEVRTLYQQENEKARKLQLDNNNLSMNLAKVQLELKNVSEKLSAKQLNHEQSKAELEINLSEYREKILPEQHELYNNLGLKFVEMVKKLEESNLLQRTDKADAQRVINHLRERNIAIKGLRKTPRQSKTKLSNVSDLKMSNSLNNHIKSEIIYEIKPEIKSEVTKKEMRTQSTQYISSSTTRSTCTSAFIKKHDVCTNFPEIIPMSVHDILREMIFDLPSRISPIKDLILKEDMNNCDNCDNIKGSGQLEEITDDSSNLISLESVNDLNSLPLLITSPEKNYKNHFNIQELDICKEIINEEDIITLDKKHVEMENLILITETKPTVESIAKDHISITDNISLSHRKCKKLQKDVEEAKTNKIPSISLKNILEINNLQDMHLNSISPRTEIEIIRHKKCDEVKKSSVTESKSTDVKLDSSTIKIETVPNINSTNELIHLSPAVSPRTEIEINAYKKCDEVKCSSVTELICTDVKLKKKTLKKDKMNSPIIELGTVPNIDVKNEVIQLSPESSRTEIEIIPYKKCDEVKCSSVAESKSGDVKLENKTLEIDKIKSPIIEIKTVLKNILSEKVPNYSMKEKLKEKTNISVDTEIIRTDVFEIEPVEIYEKNSPPSSIVIIDNIKILSPASPINYDYKISPEKNSEHHIDKSEEYSNERKSTSFDDMKVEELFDLSPSDNEELACDLECVNDLSVKELFLNDSTLLMKENCCPVSNYENIDKIAPTKNKDCINLEQNIAFEENKARQFNDLLCKKINMLRDSDKSLLDHSKEVISEKTELSEYATKLQTLNELKNILQKSAVKESIINLLSGELSNYSLASLWSLMGETIFKLIDHSRNNENSNQMQLELLNERIQMLTKQIEKEKGNDTAKYIKSKPQDQSNIIDTLIDTRNSEVMSPMSELSSIELSTETQNSAESFPENGNPNFSPIFLEKLPKQQFNCDPYKEKMKCENLNNNKLGKKFEFKKNKNQNKSITRRKEVCSNDIKNKLDFIFSNKINFAIKSSSSNNEVSAVDEILTQFPVQKKRCRKSNISIADNEINDALESDKFENNINIKKIKLEENELSTSLAGFREETSKKKKIDFSQKQIPKILQSETLNETEFNKYSGQNLMEQNEVVFHNFVENILDEFNPSIKLSPILELSGNDTDLSNSHNDFLTHDQNLEIESTHKEYENIVENSELSYKSPESPPQFYQETNLFNPIEIPLSPYNNDSPASPTMVVKDDEFEKPILIPGKRLLNGSNNFNGSKCKSLIKKFIAKFEHQKYKIIRNKSLGTVSKYQSLLIKKLYGVLDHFIKSDGTGAQLQKCIFRLVKRSKATKLICKAIVQRVQDISNNCTVQNTPPCPNMTLTHQKIICLCDYLGKHIKGFSATLIEVINSELFSLKNTKKDDCNTLINLTQLYIGVIDLISINKSPARLFICKCLYYYNVMAIPLIYQIIAAYPGILPHREDPEYDHSDPVITTIQCVLNSLPYNMLKKDLRHPEIFHILKLFYGYERVVPTKEQVIDNFIDKLRAGKLRNLSYSFAIICKQNGIEWTQCYVINNKLLPLVHEYFNEIKATDKNDANITTLLEILSFIIKPFSAKFQIVTYQDIFSNFLYATSRKTIQQSAVCALLRTSRFGLKNCFISLCKWNPTYNIDSTTKIMILSFIYKKPISFWRNLLRETKI